MHVSNLELIQTPIPLHNVPEHGLETRSKYGRALANSSMEYEKSYLFEPEQVRPAKRRRVEPEGLQASWRVRHAAYRKAWRMHQDGIDVRKITLFV